MKIRQLIAGAAATIVLITMTVPVYADEIGYVQCDEGYVNIRESADFDGTVIGKIYNNGQVFIEDYKDTWLKIKSGNVEGYIKSDFVALEEDAVQVLQAEAAYKVAYVFPEVLIVRAQPDFDSVEIDRAYSGQELEVVGRKDGWAKVCMALDSYGYVNEYYIEYRTYYGTAVSLEKKQTPEEPIVTDNYVEEYIPEEENYYYEEEVIEYDEYIPQEYTTEQEQINYNYSYEEDDYYREEEDDNYYSYEEEPDYNDYSEEFDYNYVDPEETYDYYTQSGDYEEDDDYVVNSESSSSSGRQDIVEYAQQYIGNPYVWGGTSLETGADCSGFTLAVMADNGITVNGRTAADQAAGGTQISLDEAEAGDLIYYDNGSGVYHIAIYNGDGTVTHSSSSTTGVTVSDMNYSGNAAGAVRYW